MAFSTTASSAGASLVRTSGPKILHILGSSDVRWVASGWVFFIVENTVLSENRTYLIENFGSDTYYATYGTFSTVATASILYSYWKFTRSGGESTTNKVVSSLAKGSTRMIPVASSVAGWSIMSLGLIMASQILPKIQIPVQFSSTPTIEQSASTLSNLKDESIHLQKVNTTTMNSSTPTDSRFKLILRCPFDFSSRHHGDNNEGVRGMDRISRHAGLWSLAAVFASNIFLVSPTRPVHQLWAMRTWYLGPTAVAWLGGMHADSRYRRGIGGQYDPLYTAQTSNWPFVAILSGKQGNPIQAMQSLIQSEIKPINALLALSASTLFVVRHIR